MTKIQKKAQTVWDTLVAEKKLPFKPDMVETRTLTPESNKIPFLLVLNEGRTQYYKEKAPSQNKKGCSLCEEFTLNFGVTGLKTMDVVRYEYPCLPYQFILAVNEHTTKIHQANLVEIQVYAQQTGFVLYYHKSKDSALLTSHFHIRSLYRPDLSFFTTITATQLVESSDVRIEQLNYNVFGFRLSGNKENVAEIVYTLFTGDQYPLSLVFWDQYVYLFPRDERVVPPNFGEWTFGALEIIGIFICRDRKTYQTLTYDTLEEALTVISLKDPEKQQQIVSSLRTLVERE